MCIIHGVVERPWTRCWCPGMDRSVCRMGIVQPCVHKGHSAERRLGQDPWVEADLGLPPVSSID